MRSAGKIKAMIQMDIESPFLKGPDGGSDPGTFHTRGGVEIDHTETNVKGSEERATWAAALIQSLVDPARKVTAETFDITMEPAPEGVFQAWAQVTMQDPDDETGSMKFARAFKVGPLPKGDWTPWFDDVFGRLHTMLVDAMLRTFDMPASTEEHPHVLQQMDPDTGEFVGPVEILDDKQARQHALADVLREVARAIR